MKTLIFDVFGVLVVPRRELSNLRQIFENPFEKNREMLKFISKKKGKGSKIAIISNVAQYSFEQLFSPAERELFDEIVLSGNEKVAKRDLRIFEIALNRLGEKPENCLMIDDAPENVAAAESLGMCGILYRDFDKFKEEMEKI
ncbi:MAG: HAD-IA family hydrolase [bacterium]|nr:HAD-IA family hydrolase [bacterium]